MLFIADQGLFGQSNAAETETDAKAIYFAWMEKGPNFLYTAKVT